MLNGVSNKIGSEGAKTIGEALKINATLTEFDVSNFQSNRAEEYDILVLQTTTFSTRGRWLSHKDLNETKHSKNSNAEVVLVYQFA